MEVGESQENARESAQENSRAVRCGGIKQGLSVSAAVKGWEVLVRPVLEYGCEIWGAGRWEEVERLQNSMGKRILGVNRKTSGAVVEDGGEGFSSLLFWGKLVRMNPSREKNL